MYIMKNAFISISRNKGRNILIGIIIKVIACACTITLAIRNTANMTVEEYQNANDIVGSISFDRQSLMENFKGGEDATKENIEAFNNVETLTIDSINNYGDSDYLKGYYYVYANRKILKLSGGEQQMIAVARSLSYGAKMIVADEPTGNLDKDTENDIMKIFKNLARNDDKCIIIVTHSENVCKQVDTVYELKKQKE